MWLKTYLHLFPKSKRDVGKHQHFVLPLGLNGAAFSSREGVCQWEQPFRGTRGLLPGRIRRLHFSQRSSSSTAAHLSALLTLTPRVWVLSAAQIRLTGGSRNNATGLFAHPKSFKIIKQLSPIAPGESISCWSQSINRPGVLLQVDSGQLEQDGRFWSGSLIQLTGKHNPKC